MIDGSVLQSAQRCFEKKSRVVVKMVVKGNCMSCATKFKVYFSKVEICPGLNAAAKTAKSAKI